MSPRWDAGRLAGGWGFIILFALVEVEVVVVMVGVLGNAAVPSS